MCWVTGSIYHGYGQFIPGILAGGKVSRNITQSYGHSESKCGGLAVLRHCCSFNMHCRENLGPLSMWQELWPTLGIDSMIL